MARDLVTRAHRELRATGWTAETVEKRVAFPSKGARACLHCGHIPTISILRDFLGGIDILAVKAGEPILGIQVCAHTGHATHVTKMLADPRLRVFTEAMYSRLEVWSYGLKGKSGERKLLEKRVQRIFPHEFEYSEMKEPVDVEDHTDC